MIHCNKITWNLIYEINVINKINVIKQLFPYNV
jgi:hypothetical protein